MPHWRCPPNCHRIRNSLWNFHSWLLQSVSIVISGNLKRTGIDWRYFSCLGLMWRGIVFLAVYSVRTSVVDWSGFVFVQTWLWKPWGVTDGWFPGKMACTFLWLKNKSGSKNSGESPGFKHFGLLFLIGTTAFSNAQPTNLLISVNFPMVTN